MFLRNKQALKASLVRWHYRQLETAVFQESIVTETSLWRVQKLLG